MKRSWVEKERTWATKDLTIFADPIHRYIPVTIASEDEYGEEDIIDTSWFQRLRYIGQLQMVKWVFPAAEHSRFLHCLGAMHIASKFVTKLYPSLKNSCSDCPSLPLVEETLRLAALLHDIGHGPFGHFFDHVFLEKLKGKLNHELIGQQIILKSLSKYLKNIKRSPSDKFKTGESIEPKNIGYLIKKGAAGDEVNSWVRALKPLMTGIFSVDNLDYVLRDSYFTGIAVFPVDIERLIFYCSFRKTENGPKLCIHRHGLNALDVFLFSKASLYKYVYYHRTVKALEIHLRNVLRTTVESYVKEMLKRNPDDLERTTKLLEIYPNLTDTAIIEYANSKLCSDDFARDWIPILNRQPKWKEIYSKIVAYPDLKPGIRLLEKKQFKTELDEFLKKESCHFNNYEIDISYYDPRPEHITESADELILVIEEESKAPTAKPLLALLEQFPLRVVIYRVFVPEDTEEDIKKQIKNAAEEILAPKLKGKEETAL